MSFDALAWAGKCQPGSAPRKLVLLALADRHNTESGTAYPSVQWLTEWTGLNRKTIITALDDLCKAGLISDSGKRTGATMQVKAYTLHIETVPKTERSQKRNSPKYSVKQSQKRDTEPVMEPELNKPNGLSSVKTPKIDDGKLQPAHVVEAWNAMASRLGKPTVRELTPQRRQMVKARIAQHQLDDFHAVFGKLEASPFLRGDGNWKKGATFDWLMKQGNFLKVLEGNYD